MWSLSEPGTAAVLLWLWDIPSACGMPWGNSEADRFCKPLGQVCAQELRHPERGGDQILGPALDVRSRKAGGTLKFNEMDPGKELQEEGQPDPLRPEWYKGGGHSPGSVDTRQA